VQPQGLRTFSDSKDINMNLTTFFSYVRRAPFGGRLTQAQIDGMTAILTEWDRRKLLDKRWLGYMLATSFHESGFTMQPIREMGGQKYLSKYDTGKLAKTLGNTPQADGDGQKFAGRGLVQITGRSNYRAFGIEGKPDEALKMPTAVRILFDGMIKGMFTGKKLGDYFNAATDDAEGARRIVNGTDKKSLIAGYHKNFMDALEAAQEVLPPLDVSKADASADDKPAGQSTTAVTTVGGLFGGAGLSAILGVDNVYAFGIAALLIILGSLAAFMFFTGRWSVNRGKTL